MPEETEKSEEGIYIRQRAPNNIVAQQQAEVHCRHSRRLPPKYLEHANKIAIAIVTIPEGGQFQIE